MVWNNTSDHSPSHSNSTSSDIQGFVEGINLKYEAHVALVAEQTAQLEPNQDTLKGEELMVDDAAED